MNIKTLIIIVLIAVAQITLFSNNPQKGWDDLFDFLKIFFIALAAVNFAHNHTPRATQADAESLKRRIDSLQKDLGEFKEHCRERFATSKDIERVNKQIDSMYERYSKLSDTVHNNYLKLVNR